MFQKMRNSLVVRLTALSLVIVSLTLLVSDMTLLGAYEASLRRILDNHITAYTDVLVPMIKLRGGEIVLDDDQVLSRIPRYWQISADGKNLYRSQRLKGWITPRPETPTESQRFDVVDSDGVKISAVQATYVFPGDKPVTLIFGLDRKVSDAYLAQERGRLEWPLQIILVAEGLLLTVFSYVLTRYAISPIKAVNEALRHIREGKEERIKGKYPQEIAELATGINHLLDYISGIMARYRDFSSNLAHALKTPMTVIRNEQDIGVIRDKAQGMLDMIERSLARAHAAPSSNILSATTRILPVLQDIAQGFGKVYGKTVELDYPAHYLFKGDKADLYESVGNIIENACKYARSRVRIGEDDGAVIVEDDGEGIPASERSKVLMRGTRLDKSKPGTGIGLAIARDILALYGGGVALDASGLSGLKVVIRLPVQR